MSDEYLDGIMARPARCIDCGQVYRDGFCSCTRTEMTTQPEALKPDEVNEARQVVANAYLWLSGGYPAQAQDHLRNALLAWEWKINPKFDWSYSEYKPETKTTSQISGEATEIARNLIRNRGVTADQVKVALDIINVKLLTLANAYLAKPTAQISKEELAKIICGRAGLVSACDDAGGCESCGRVAQAILDAMEGRNA